MKIIVLCFMVVLIAGFFKAAQVAGFFSTSNLTVHDEVKTLINEEAKIAQEELEKALKALKREIRTEVNVDNGGSITGNVRHTIVLYPENREIRTEVNVDNGGSITGNVRHTSVLYPENVVVYIEEVGDNKYPVPLEHGIVDRLNLTFVPHVIAIQRGTTVDFVNSDFVRHNVFSPPECCKQFNIGTYDVGVTKTVTFDEACEIPLLCNAHTDESAFVRVLDNPYFSVTRSDGVFKIENVPSGTYKLSAWHEKLRTITKDVTVESGKTANVDFSYAIAHSEVARIYGLKILRRNIEDYAN